MIKAFKTALYALAIVTAFSAGAGGKICQYRSAFGSPLWLSSIPYLKYDGVQIARKDVFFSLKKD